MSIECPELNGKGERKKERRKEGKKESKKARKQEWINGGRGERREEDEERR